VNIVVQMSTNQWHDNYQTKLQIYYSSASCTFFFNQHRNMPIEIKRSQRIYQRIHLLVHKRKHNFRDKSLFLSY